MGGMKSSSLFFACFFWLMMVACQPQTAQPLVIIATPSALDANFQTYQHASGVFSLRIPPQWIPDELPADGGLRIQFTSIEGSERVVRLSISVINTGHPLTAEAFIQAVNAYQPPPDLAQIPWAPTSDLAAMPDGSVRLAGIRAYPTLGTRALNIFLQGNGSYFSALEVDVTDIPPDVLQTLLAVVNTYRVNPTMPLNVGEVTQAGIVAASGVVEFLNYWHWSDINGGFNLTGQVKNNADSALEAIRLTAYLYDSEGNQLAQHADVLPYEVLASGELAPFRLRFDTGRPSTAVRYEIHVAARTVESNRQDVGNSQYFLIGEDQALYNSSDNLVIRGLVQNNHTQLASNIRITATVFNEQGQVVATETTFIPRETLVPNEASPFEVTLYDLGGNAFRYTLTAHGNLDG